MQLTWSNDLLVMFRPGRTYKLLATSRPESGWWVLVRRPLFLAFLTGTFVSITSTGRFFLPLVLDGMVAWSFIPMLQGLVLVAIILSLSVSKFRLSTTLDLFFMSHGAWMIWLLAVAGMCLFFPIEEFYLWPTVGGWGLPVSLLAAFIVTLSAMFGFFRNVLDLSRLRAAMALLTYFVAFWGGLIGYVLMTGVLPLQRVMAWIRSA
jgi:hypothetical protein